MPLKERRMGVFANDGTALLWRGGHETVRIEPWGADSLRVRGTLWRAIRDDFPGALLPAPPGGEPGTTTIGDEVARISNGQLAAEITADGRIRFFRASDGADLLSEVTPHFTGPPQRRYTPSGSGGSHH